MLPPQLDQSTYELDSARESGLNHLKQRRIWLRGVDPVRETRIYF